MSKSLRNLLGVTILGVSMLFASPQKSSAEIYGFIGISPAMIKTPTSYSEKINSVPAIVRDVPAHPDDLYKTLPQDVAPIADSSFSWSASGIEEMVEVKAGVGIKKGIFDLRIGPKMVCVTGDHNFGFPIKERNYLNHPGTDIHGTDAALTYYKFNDTALSSGIIFGGIAETSLLFDIEEGFALGPFVEYSFLPLKQEFSFENGWDRYDKLGKKSKYTFISDLFYQTIKAGLKISMLPGIILIYGGADFLNPSSLPFSKKEIDFSIEERRKFFFGVRFTMSYDTRMEFSNL
jgi:hypothetical protein